MDETRRVAGTKCEERSGYQGDAALGPLLRQAGSAYDVAGVRALIAGIVAAPPGFDAEAWIALIVPDPAPQLRVQLLALAAELRAAADIDPFPPGAALDRLERLRAELVRLGVHGFLVPRADEHQSEYVPAHGQRLAWLTGFTGSAGLAMVLPKAAAIFVDGRYTLQAKVEVDGQLYQCRHVTDQPPMEWIATTLQPGETLAYDPRLHTAGEVERYRAAAERAGGSLLALPDNPLDAVWSDQPPPPLAPVAAHPLRFAGEDAADKRRRIAADLVQANVDALVLTAPDSIAWLLNIRGGDVPHTPVALAFAILDCAGAVTLFIDHRKLLPGLIGHLGPDVLVAEPAEFGASLEALGIAGKTVQADPATAAAWVLDRLAAGGATIRHSADPCQLAKACKNGIEIDGARAAHRRDGAALTHFLAWLTRTAPMGSVGEIAAADRLYAFRRGGEYFRDLSFDTISGGGANGAIVHYRASPRTDHRLTPGMLYLVDSGAQYLDGTTDVTRTVAIGRPDSEMCDRFTRVLKGHIALARCRFPKGTVGSQLDVLARRWLWEAGLDYDHGTGHGVGSYLGVHEGPQRISKLPGTQPLLPGMIISNEPGYYKAGAYGIRIENLVLVVPIDGVAGAERNLLGFETLTLAPIDRSLIDKDLLDADEAFWLDGYHARVRAELTPLLDAETAAWLTSVTRPIAAA